ADLVVGADDRALEEAPGALGGVGVNVTPHTFLRGVVDGDVLGVLVADALVANPLVRVDRLSVVGDDLIEKARQRPSVTASRDSQPNLSAPLDSADHSSLVDAVEEIYTIA